MMNSHSAAQAVVYSVIENVRASAVTRDELMKALSSGAGDSTVVRTLFGDVSLLTILRLAIEFGISDRDLARAYVSARRYCGARNLQLDEFAAKFGHELDFDAPLRLASPQPLSRVSVRYLQRLFRRHGGACRQISKVFTQAFQHIECRARALLPLILHRRLPIPPPDGSPAKTRLTRDEARPACGPELEKAPMHVPAPA
jgi:AraC-like DNA-binding protein